MALHGHLGGNIELQWVSVYCCSFSFVYVASSERGKAFVEKFNNNGACIPRLMFYGFFIFFPMFIEPPNSSSGSHKMDGHHSSSLTL